MRFEEKAALVIGGANGIGAAIAGQLATEDAKVVIADIDRPAGESLAERLRADGRDAVFVSCDVRYDDQTTQAVAATVETHGRLDVAVHSAYRNTKVGLTELPPDEWDEILAVLIRSAWTMTKAAVPHLAKAPDGNIVHVSSVAAARGSTSGIAYGVSKAGLESLVRYTAVEFGPQGIRCNAIAPGLIIVDRNREMWTEDPTRLSAATGRFPLQRAGTPEEVAAAVAFLAGADASFITGTILAVDGGLLAGAS